MQMTLRSGAKMPSVALGTWKIPKETCAQVVEDAIKAGYRHLDCACDYGNEVQVGQGIKAAIAAGVCKREDLWITSKLWNTYHAKEHVKPALQKTLTDLGLEYLDLYLIHFPISLKYVPFETRYPPEWIFDPSAKEPSMEIAGVPIAETWAAMEELQGLKLTREIGVSNFSCALLMDLFASAKSPPSVLQVELHPYNTQERLRRFATDLGIAVVGFSCLGASGYVEIGMATEDDSLLKNEVVLAIAKTHARSAAQVALKWALQSGHGITPKSTNADRLKENLTLDFTLTAEDMKAIDGLNKNRRFNDPGHFCEAAFGKFYPIYN